MTISFLTGHYFGEIEVFTYRNDFELHTCKEIVLYRGEFSQIPDVISNLSVSAIIPFDGRLCVSVDEREAIECSLLDNGNTLSSHDNP